MSRNTSSEDQPDVRQIEKEEKHQKRDGIETIRESVEIVQPDKWFLLISSNAKTVLEGKPLPNRTEERASFVFRKRRFLCAPPREQRGEEYRFVRLKNGSETSWRTLLPLEKRFPYPTPGRDPAPQSSERIQGN